MIIWEPIWRKRGTPDVGDYVQVWLSSDEVLQGMVTANTNKLVAITNFNPPKNLHIKAWRKGLLREYGDATNGNKLRG